MKQPQTLDFSEVMLKDVAEAAAKEAVDSLWKMVGPMDKEQLTICAEIGGDLFVRIFREATTKRIEEYAFD